ncbi:F-box protein GID2 [Iris pallida]|uniref:F-box protein GID2 n=1 Tax=Iris pallida TaxID=29817 RepID=A0AAX6FAQ6_IRIPA|nr:F-box protein GID2 [Iris pallida]KAJ6829218.1 F-box protein GID2 [Iris pallida]
MKRPESASDLLPPEKKKRKSVSDEEEEATEAPDLGEDLVLEVLKRADARTVARAACVSRRWRRMAEDERLWEAVCTAHWASIGCGTHQLRSVVLALGGFRRLHSAYLLPLLQPASRPLSGPFSPGIAPASGGRWGKDEVQLSLSLLSIGYFMTTNFGRK